MKRILGVAALLCGALATPAAAATIYAANGSNQLVTMDSVTPSAGQTATPITGLQAGEAVVSLDVRPAGGELYGVAVNGTSGRLYRIDPQTAAATAVGTGPFSNALGSAVTGFNFNPAVDRARVVNTADQNLRLVPDTGVQLVDTSLAYAPGDVSAGADPAVIAVAYTNAFQGATTTTVFGYDQAADPDALVVLSPPNGGVLSTVGAAGTTINSSGVGGFDIQPGTNAAFVALSRPGVVGGQWLLYDLNLTTGQITGGRTIGASPIRGIAVAPTAKFVVEAPSSVGEGAGALNVTIRRTGSTAGPSSVRLTSSGGTATAGGTDYTGTGSVVPFADGAATAQVPIPITDDSAVEGPETFDLQLADPTAGAFVGRPFKSTITITDNDTAAAAPPALTPETPAQTSAPVVAPRDTTKPALALSLRRTIRLRSLLRSGLAIAVTPSEAVALRADLRLGRTRVARVTRQLKAGRTRLVLRLSKKARSRVRRSHATSLTLAISATDAAGNLAAPVSRRVRLGRR